MADGDPMSSLSSTWRDGMREHATEGRRPDGLHYSDGAATEIADDFLAPVLIDAAVS